jgi:nucleotide-binding universal stress UspA family protein
MLLAGTSTILVPTDFSDAAERALTAAIELAQMWTASIELLHVSVDPTFVAMPPGSILPIPVDLTESIGRENEQLTATAARVRRLGLNCTTATSSGRTHVEIIDHAIKSGAGLIAMGTHEHRGISQTLLGSVAEKVLRHAPCPVLVVPLLAGGAEQKIEDSVSLASEPDLVPEPV